MRALITAAEEAGGIGMATARALGRAGCEVVISGPSGRIFARQAELLAEGIPALAHQGDLSQPVEVARLLGLGPLEVLVHQAQPPGPDGDESRARDAGLSAAVLLTRALLPAMRQGGFGRVILLASPRRPGRPADPVELRGLQGLCHGLAPEVAGQGITVNTLLPGWIEPDPPAAPPTHPRAGTPAEVAHAVAFLAAPLASYVNGATLAVDGGLFLQEPLT